MCYGPRLSPGKISLERRFFITSGSLPSAVAADHQLAAVAANGPQAEPSTFSFVPERPMAFEIAPDPFQCCGCLHVVVVER